MNSSSVTIRAALPPDLDALVELLALLFSLEADFAVDGVRQRRGLELLAASASACILVAEVNKRVVGMATGQLTISTAEGGPALLVEDVVIRVEWRGQGIGRRLLAVLAAWARQRGARRLQLLADSNNLPALAFYRHLGWHSTQLICQRKIVGEETRRMGGA